MPNLVAVVVALLMLLVLLGVMGVVHFLAVAVAGRALLGLAEPIRLRHQKAAEHNLMLLGVRLLPHNQQ